MRQFDRSQDPIHGRSGGKVVLKDNRPVLRDSAPDDAGLPDRGDDLGRSSHDSGAAVAGTCVPGLPGSRLS